MNHRTSFRRLIRPGHLALPSYVLGVMILIGLLIFPFSASAIGNGSESVSDFYDIDAYIESEMQAANLPGLALGIVQGDQTVFLKGYGNTGNGSDVTPQTPFLSGISGTQPDTQWREKQVIPQR